MLSDLRHAFRQFAKAPGFTAMAVLTLAVGIGANTAFFSVLHQSLLRPLPYPNQDRIVHLDETYNTSTVISLSYPNFTDWHDRQTAFSALAFYNESNARVKLPDRIDQITVAKVSWEFFKVLGVQPALGRTIAAEDDRPNSAPVAWISHELSQRLFGPAAEPVGQVVRIDDSDIQIAGVLPAGFHFIRNFDVYLPVAPSAERSFLNLRAAHQNSHAIGLLKPGESVASAQIQLDTITSSLREQYPTINGNIGARVLPLQERLSGQARSGLLLLSGAVALVLLIACVNLANMLLARSFSRAKEMAIRTSLGATRGQIVRQLLTESLLLALAGGFAGLLLGLWSYELLNRLVPSEIVLLFGKTGHLDPAVLAFTATLTVLTGLGFGLAPALQLSHVNPGDALKQSPRIVSTRWGRLHLRDLLVATQVALAVVLLVGASLLIRSLQRLLEVDPGIKPAHILTLQVTPPAFSAFQEDPRSLSSFHQATIDAIQPVPGIDVVATGSMIPFSGNRSGNAFYLDDAPLPEPGKCPIAGIHSVSTDYFKAMGIPLLRGRLFDGHEPVPNYPAGIPFTPDNFAHFFKGVVFQGVISQSMADKFWPGQDPVGKRFHLGFPNMVLPTVEIIGVVGDVTNDGLENGRSSEFYLSLRQFTEPSTTYMVIRTHIDPAAVSRDVRLALAKAFPENPVTDLKLMTARLDEQLAGRRFNLKLFTFFAGTALLLALFGLYGVLSFLVGQRTREIGIKMALGADRCVVLKDIMKRGLWLVVPGLVLGSLLAWLASRLLQSQLFAVTRSDPSSYFLAAGLLFVSAVVSCLLPARRATKIDPIEALRSE